MVAQEITPPPRRNVPVPTTRGYARGPTVSLASQASYAGAGIYDGFSQHSPDSPIAPSPPSMAYPETSYVSREPMSAPAVEQPERPPRAARAVTFGRQPDQRSPGVDSTSVADSLAWRPSREEARASVKFAPSYDLAPAEGGLSRPSPGYRTETSESLAPLSTPYEGLARSGGTVRKRQRTVKLPSSGNFSIKERLPEGYLKNVAYNKGDDFETIKYTACTCDPDEFLREGYTLRAAENQRDTEIAIVVTMYNEGVEELTRTLFGLFQNIQTFCQKNKRGWGADGWKKIVVVLVSDGRKKVNPQVLLALQTMGIYLPGMDQQSVNGKPTTAHIFESTSQLVLDPQLSSWTTTSGVPPVQFIFCLKEQNKKKINSHRWFFNAFCPILRPEVTFLVDVGTRPLQNSIWKLWKAFEDPHVGGACGEIRVGMTWRGILNPLVASQNFEYKISNSLDKALESVCGYIGVLPGAFSAYRYTALLENMPNRGPLASYFKGEHREGDVQSSSGTQIFAANLYLAEDRILALELVAKPSSSWVLKYVANSAAETDVPDSVPEFIAQRRRWLNGSFFAQMYAIANIGRTLRTNHTPQRKLVFLLQAIYQIVSLAFNWFGPAQFAIIFYFLFSSNQVASFIPFAVAQVFFLIYPTLLCLLFIASLGNRPQASKKIYTTSMAFFAAIGLTMLVLLVYKVFKIIQANKGLGHVSEIGSGMSYVVGLGATYGTYLLGSLLQGDAWHMFHSSIQYMLMLPSYINVLQIYAFCNLHDVSWGTKGDNEGSDLPTVRVVQNADGAVVADIHVVERKDLEAAWSSGIEELRHFNASDVVKHVDPRLAQEDAYKAFRTNLLLGWLGSNMVLFGVITQTSNNLADKYIVYLLFATAGLAAIRILGVVLYQLSRVVHGLLSSCSSTKEAKKANRNSVPPSAPPGFTVIGNRYNGFEVVKDDKATGSPSIFLGA